MREIPFKAALFDLDGTLLDSLYVWARVDEMFFENRGMKCPEGYGRAIAGLSYRESAEYTVKNYVPDETPEGLIDEWMRLAAIEYAENVQLKPGGLKYLRLLKRAGVKMAVTTAMPPELFMPCLERLGAAELFDELLSTEHVGGRGKGSGELFRFAAEKLGAKPEDCAVFEDVPAGISGAKLAGMRAYCVRDEHNRADFPQMEAVADSMLDSLDDMRAVHDFPASPRCVVFTARCEGDVGAAYVPEENDFILCADGGWKIAQKAGVEPHCVIGDFDSSDAPESGAVETHPVMKDDTDTMLCLKKGLALGYERFLFVGGFGGRLDHTLANLQSLHYAAVHGAQAEMNDGICRAMVVRDGAVKLARRDGKLSLFALTDKCLGVTVRGALYPVEDGELTNAFPLGVSNDYAADEVEISVRDGALLIVQCPE